MDKKEARRILGVTKEASRSDIERKYSILLKKHRQEMLQNKHSESEQPDEPEDSAASAAIEQSGAADGNEATSLGMTGQKGEKVSEDSAGEADFDFNRITEAYNVLMGYDVKVQEEAPGKAAPILKKIGIDEKKAKNFFYYYKYYIIGIIVLLAVIISTVGSCINRPDYDFNIAFIGNIYYFDSADELQESIKQNVPEIKEPSIDGAYLSDNEQGLTDDQYAMETKAFILTSAADVDVFILDRNCYERYAKHGVFMSLDDIAPKLGVDISEHQDLVLAEEEDEDTEDTDGTDRAEESKDESGGETAGQEHLYGIDVSDSTALKESGIAAEDMIAAIFAGCEQQEKAEALLRFLLK